MVSRIKQDSNLIGPEGGVLSSTVVPQVQAVFPEGALTKRIRVGLQVANLVFTMEIVDRRIGIQRMCCQKHSIANSDNTEIDLNRCFNSVVIILFIIAFWPGSTHEC